jgi:hypothetical protein
VLIGGPGAKLLGDIIVRQNGKDVVIADPQPFNDPLCVRQFEDRHEANDDWARWSWKSRAKSEGSVRGEA